MAHRKRKPDSTEHDNPFISYDPNERPPRQSPRLVEKATRPPPATQGSSTKKPRNSSSLIPTGLELPNNQMAPPVPARKRASAVKPARPKPRPRNVRNLFSANS